MLKELEVSEPMLGNTAYRALCERMGFVPVSAKPKAEAMTALASVLKGRAAQLQAEEDARHPERDWNYPYNKAWAVNPNLPMELEDGTPCELCHVSKDTERANIKHGRTTPFPGGDITDADSWYYDLDTGLWTGSNEGERWKLRNVGAKAVAIDWDLPIEFIDGTPAIVPEDNNTLKNEGTYRVEVVDGHQTPAPLVGKYGSSYGGWWFKKSGMLDEDRFKDAGVLIRNRVAKAIDWKAPLETVDGDEAEWLRLPSGKFEIARFDHRVKVNGRLANYKEDGTPVDSDAPRIRNRKD